MSCENCKSLKTDGQNDWCPYMVNGIVDPKKYFDVGSTMIDYEKGCKFSQ